MEEYLTEEGREDDPEGGGAFVNRNLFDQMYDKINELQVQSAMEKEEMLKLCDMMMVRQTNIIVDN